MKHVIDILLSHKASWCNGSEATATTWGMNRSSSSDQCPMFCYGFWVERRVSWKQCATWFQIRFLVWWVCLYTCIYVLIYCISVWCGNGSSQDCKALKRVVRLAEHISVSALKLNTLMRLCSSSLEWQN